jgi:hypothetical protein
MHSFSSLSCVLATSAAACGGESDPGTDFFKGNPAGSAGAAGSGGETQYPSYESIDYPAGPYGTEKGSVIANYELLGWSRPAEVGYDVNQFNRVRFSDLYDPDGSKATEVRLSEFAGGVVHGVR